ncbi:MAG: DUF1573 domain-containing protein, partial [Prevotella sp.]|nr:DUF1573 domain-containing protein [Prevotella sp.]
MKKLILLTLISVLFVGYVSAQETQENQPQASIKFDTTKHDFGTFSSKDYTQKCTFTFTNVGDAPLIINQAVASCGCTVPSYTKSPVAPGEKGTIDVTYKGKGKTPGHFNKSITVSTNGVPERVRLYIEGVMKDDE